DDGLTLRIADDGQGFDPAAVPGGHLGLQTMTERSQRVNGVMAIRSTPGAGTTIQVTVPRTALAEVATHV
ncbi:MAG: histidine kinase, partial [Chloroflexi bacterium]|nr:histidine kinase [Chloroflexota bacterium]